MEFPRYPELLCIGAQKAATTWLYDLLVMDPRLVLPPIKELHFFSQLHEKTTSEYAAEHRRAQVEENRRWFVENPDRAGTAPDYYLANLDHARREAVDDFWYARFFEHAGDGRRCVDICPSYFNMPEPGVAHAAALIPARAKVLVIVRDPVDRAFSQIRMHIARGLEDRDLSLLVSGRRTLWPYLFLSDYAAAITRWETFAGPGRLKLVLYDMIGADPAQGLAQVYRLLDLEPPPVDPVTYNRVFQGEAMAIPPALRAKLYAELQDQYAFLELRLPQAVAGWRAGHEAALAASG